MFLHKALTNTKPSVRSLFPLKNAVGPAPGIYLFHSDKRASRAHVGILGSGISLAFPGIPFWVFVRRNNDTKEEMNAAVPGR